MKLPRKRHPRQAGPFRGLAVLAGLLFLAGPVVLSADEPLPVRIDQLIATGADNFDEVASPLADDAEFLRRIYLDLTGSIPPVERARQFLADTDPDKRTRLIDELLASPEYARQMQRQFDLMLMQRRPARYVPAAEWQAYLRNSFAENKPWDQLAREILSADGTDDSTRPAARFYLDREGEVNEITRDIGRVFLGVNLECAQCHDHPQIPDWKQQHYYGISAFLVRSFLFKDSANRAVFAEKADGEVTFESVFEVRDKISTGPKTTFPVLFEGERYLEPKFDFGEEYVVAPAKDVQPIPKFSRRAFLGEAVTDPENRFFARSIANRLWALMMGRGLIHPVDYDHSENPPSHPELLDLLADDMVARKFDIRGFLRDLALTKTYQRSSRRPPERLDEEPPEVELFAQAMLKPLLPEQLALSILEATGYTATQRASLGDKLTEDLLAQRLVGVENTFLNLFGSEPGTIPKEFDATVEQALFLSNDAMIHSWLNPNSLNLTGRLGKLPEDNPQAIAEELYLSVLTRFPEEDEVQAVSAYLADRGAERAQALQELVWALVTSAEFRFNH